MNTTTSIQGVLMILLAAVLWGSTGTAQSFAPAGLSALSAYWVGALRLIVASAFFMAFVLAVYRNRWAELNLRRLPWPWVLCASAGIAVYNLAFFAGIRATGVAVGTAVAIGSGPIWAGLLQALATGRRPALAWCAGTALAVTGGALMIVSNGAQITVTALGVGLCLLSGFSYAAYALVNKRMVGQASASVVTMAVFTLAAALATPVAWALSGGPHATATEWAIVIYLGVVTTGVAYLLFSHGLRHVSGAGGVTLALGEPVTAFVLAIVVVGERPSALAFAGLLLVLMGLVAVVWAELTPAQRELRAARC